MSEEIKKEINQEFKLTDEHANILSQHASALQNFYALIGQQFCEVLKNVSQAASIEKSIEDLQNDIAKELKVPRANRLSWNLNKKTIEIID